MRNNFSNSSYCWENTSRSSSAKESTTLPASARKTTTTITALEYIGLFFRNTGLVWKAEDKSPNDGRRPWKSRVSSVHKTNCRKAQGKMSVPNRPQAQLKTTSRDEVNKHPVMEDQRPSPGTDGDPIPPTRSMETTKLCQVTRRLNRFTKIKYYQAKTTGMNEFYLAITEEPNKYSLMSSMNMVPSLTIPKK